MEKSRTDNSIRNIIFGLISQVIILFLNFISRTIFIKILGNEYLGINGLFSNILMILSLAELGIGNAIIYSMYKPLASNNREKVTAIMNLYKKIYNIIALAIFIIGLTIIPILKFIVNSNIEMKYIIIYYLLYLMNSVISYLFASKTAILNADQKMYIVKIYTLIFTVLQIIIQIVLLYLTKSFAIYLIIQIIFTFLINLYGALKVKKLYPYLKGKEKLPKKEVKTIIENIKSMFVYKVGGVILNNTDNILISILVGTISVGFYSNYYMIINSITTFTNIIFSSITASIGNLTATTNEDKQYRIFKITDFISAIMFGIISICLLVLYNDFILVWIGKDYIIDYGTIIAIVLNFYLVGRASPVGTFRETLGMFKKTKYIFMITAIINIILSIILGKILGMFGIILATAIARIMTNRWYEPYILYKDYFNKKLKDYWKNEFVFFIYLLLNLFITNIIFSHIKVNNLFEFAIKAIICLIVVSILYIIEFNKREEFRYFINIILERIKNKWQEKK